RAAELSAAALARGVRVESADHPALERLARSPHHQGAVAVAPPFAYAPLERLLAPRCPSALVLDGLQDPRNLGAILRTARPPGAGGGRGGWGAPAARPTHLRLHGLHPHGPGCRVAQRRGGGRDRPLRADGPPVEFITPFAELGSLTAYGRAGRK